MEKFKELILTYCQNMDRQRELDEALLADVSKEEWIASLHERATSYEALSVQNNQIIKQANAIFEQPMTDEMALQYYEILCKEMYDKAYDEYEILLPAFYQLLKYNQTNINYKKSLCDKIYFEEHVVQANALGEESVDVKMLEEALSMRERYAEFSEKSRDAFWNSWFNYIIACLDGECPDPDLSCERLKELLAFWETDLVQEVDGQSEAFLELIDGLKLEWLGVQEYMDEANGKTKAYFCELADYYFKRECEPLSDPLMYSNEIYAAHLRAEIFRGTKTYDEVVAEYFDYYVKRCKDIPNDVNNDRFEFYFLTNTPMTLEKLCQHVADEKLKKKVIRTLITNTKRTWYNQCLEGMDSVMNTMLRTWCFTMLKYMKTTSEKIDWIVELVVRKQLPTYLHSAMVRNIAEAIGREITRQQPEYFDDLPDELIDNILGYIRVSAILHDVGKTRITNVITTQGRYLSDQEFGSIRKHPEYGYNVMIQDPDLKQFADVVIGHHKFYDGTGGYPMNFDNVASPVRCMIDIITISDCLDAATDYLGRNYKKAKTFEEVMDEFRRDKGTRYNPELVDIIDSSPRLKKELEYIVGEGRVDTMYKAYLQNAI